MKAISESPSERYQVDVGRKPLPEADKAGEPVTVRLRADVLARLDALSATTRGHPTRPQLLREAVQFYLDNFAPAPGKKGKRDE